MMYMKRKGRKLVSLLMLVSLVITVINWGAMITVSAETKKKEISYVTDEYEVIMRVTDQWADSFNAEITLKNRSSHIIENWALCFNFEYDVVKIWDAAIKQKEGVNYVIKNVGSNQDIDSGKSVTFGFTAKGNGTIELPSIFELQSFEENVSNEKYNIEYKVISEWENKYNGEIIINNISNEAIEDWKLAFDTKLTIERFYTATILYKNGDSYYIKNNGYNSVIKPGEKIILRFEGKGKVGKNNPTNYILTQVVNKPSQVDTWKDSDHDGLADWLENEYGTNYMMEDTDGDGLNDYLEILLGLDPLAMDSDSDGILDGYVDSDGDGLTNIEELQLGSDCIKKDSDGDGLFDGDEVHMFGTSPILEDTDQDGLTDGDEILLNLNPNEKYSDGALLDSERTIEQVLSLNNISANLIDESNIVPFNISATCTGVLDKQLRIMEVDSESLLNNSSIVGKPFELSGILKTDTQINVNFDCNVYHQLNANMDVKNIKLFQLLNNDFVPVNTDYNNQTGIISASVSGNGIYFLMNVETFLDDVGIDVNTFNIEMDSNSIGTYTKVQSINENPKSTVQKGQAEVTFIIENPEEYEELPITLVKYLESSFNICVKYNIMSVLDLCNKESEVTNCINTKGGADKFVIFMCDSYNDKVLSLKNELYNNDITVYQLSSISYTNKKAIGISTQSVTSECETIADYIGDEVNEGVWILLNDYQYVKLDGVLSSTNGIDTDDDGISDYCELGQPVEKDLSDLTTCILESKDIPEELYREKSTITVYNYASNPTLPDTDFDGIDDAYDDNIYNNNFSGALRSSYATSNVSYTMDYREFFKDNTVYSEKISVISTLLSSVIYDNTTFDNMKIEAFMKRLGLTDIVRYNIASMYSDNDVSEAYIGHRRVSYNGKEKEILAVIVRGTNGTMQEWSSNFDVGSTKLRSKSPDWIVENNHKGFDVAATRIIKCINAYNNLNYMNPSTEKAYWVTGHSRGAGISNIVGARLSDTGNKVYTYTYAAPNTTTATTASSYKGIYNVLNKDDFVPYLPMTAWGFTRYGKNVIISIADNYEKEWEELTKCKNAFGVVDYNWDAIGMNDTVNTIGNIVNHRNDCYVFTCQCHGDGSLNKITIKNRGTSEKSREDAIKKIPSNALPYCQITRYKGFLFAGWDFDVCQQPEYFMQILAAYMSGQINEYRFVVELNIASRYEAAKTAIIRSGLGGLAHPHYTESYYVLAKHVTNSQFK